MLNDFEDRFGEWLKGGPSLAEALFWLLKKLNDKIGLFKGAA